MPVLGLSAPAPATDPSASGGWSNDWDCDKSEPCPHPEAMAWPNDPSRPLCANGPTLAPTKVRHTKPKPFHAGCITSTGVGPTPASATGRPSAVFRFHEKLGGFTQLGDHAEEWIHKRVSAAFECRRWAAVVILAACPRSTSWGPIAA
jgi:hypothetical protein